MVSYTEIPIYPIFYLRNGDYRCCEGSFFEKLVCLKESMGVIGCYWHSGRWGQEAHTQRVQVPNNKVLGIWVIVIIIQILGKYMIIRYLGIVLGF